MSEDQKLINSVKDLWQVIPSDSSKHKIPAHLEINSCMKYEKMVYDYATHFKMNPLIVEEIDLYELYLFYYFKANENSIQESFLPS